MWYMWCLTILYATKLVLPVQATRRHLHNPENVSTLLWTFLEWYSPLTWWRTTLNNIANFRQLDRLPEQELEMFTSVFIVHRPYFQHPHTKDFWTQDQAFEFMTLPHPYPILHDPNNNAQLKAYLFEINNIQPPIREIHHTSIGPNHKLELSPHHYPATTFTKPQPTGIVIREERPDFTDFLFQDSQDPWEEFMSLVSQVPSPYSGTMIPTPTVPDPPKSQPSLPATADVKGKKKKIRHITSSGDTSESDSDTSVNSVNFEDKIFRRKIRKAQQEDEEMNMSMSPSRFPSTP